MPLSFAHGKLAAALEQRCFYLFIALLVLIVVVPNFANTEHARLIDNLMNTFILLAAVAAVGRSRAAFVIAGLLAAVTLGVQWLSYALADASFLPWSWVAAALFYLVTLTYLIAHVFRKDVMTADKLYGAAAAFLMLGVLWTYFYVLMAQVWPGALARPGAGVPSVSELIYFSFTVLTGTGLTDIMPVTPLARSVVMVEQIVGTLFVAILIARLAGIYPPKE